jgi:hypothetical protein
LHAGYATLTVMKLIIMYRSRSDHGRQVEEFIREFKERYEAPRVEVLDVDSREGVAMASLYDIMQYPAILATRNDGSVMNTWQGRDLPLLDEVAYYAMA